MLHTIKKKIANISYKKLFFIEEIEESKILQVLFYVISLSFFVTFYAWNNSNVISISSVIRGINICPPYFQSCGSYYFLESLPYGYTQGFFYVILFLIISFGLLSAMKNDWENAHKTILAGFIWKIVFIFIFTYGVGGNFDYYDLFLAFVFLFLKYKELFAKLLFITFYFAASTIKIHEGWIFGNYLNSTILGAPFFGEQLLPIFTNIVILMQIVGCWFLFSKNEKVQRIAFIYFFLFHLYSGIIVNYRYITISLTSLVVLFGYNFKILKIDQPTFLSILPISKKTFFGYLFLVSVLLLQSIAILIPGDQKKTLEGNYYGLYMFEANHQCESLALITYKNGSLKELRGGNSIANNRCDPYRYWYPLKVLCERDETIKKINWTFDHSINGHKFQRIVDEDNACTLTYKNLEHNAWIKLEDEAVALDKPVYKNGYSRNIYPESRNIPTNPVKSPYLGQIESAYWILWISTLIYVSFLIIRKRE